MAAPGKLWVPDRRDMIWIDFSPQTGGQMKDEHPMMMWSPKAFNQRTNIVIGLPMNPCAIQRRQSVCGQIKDAERRGLFCAGASAKIFRLA